MKYNPYRALASVEMAPGATRSLLAYQSGEHGYTINLMKAKAGVAAPPHSHPHLQAIYILSGRGEFQCGDELQMLQAGDVLQIDANVPHTFASVLEDTEWLEFFTPEREDYQPKQD